MKHIGCILMAVSLLLVTGLVPGRAEEAAHPDNALSGIVIAREMYQPPGPTGWPIHAYVSRAILAVFTLRYRNANHWRVQGRYLAAPHDPFLLRNGALATPFHPFPGSVVQQGLVIRHFNAHHRVVTQVMAASDGMNPLYGNASLYLDHQPVDSLGKLLKMQRHCRSATVHGTQVIAGRGAYVINLGPDQCGRALGAGYLFAGREVAWLDMATLVLLRLDHYFPKSQRLLVQTVTTRVSYSGTS